MSDEAMLELQLRRYASAIETLEAENGRLRKELEQAKAKHTDRSTPCPCCGFVIKRVERKPFAFDEGEDK